MSRNGTGTYSLPAGNPVVTGTTITSTWANNTLNDIATALTDSVAADGQTPMIGDLDMNTNKIINLEAGTVAGNAIEYDQFVAATTTNVNITGGTINGTSIGETTRSSGKFTTLSANSTLGVTGATTLSSTLGVTGYATFGDNGEFNGTGALKLPTGTTAQQPTPATGMLRFNSSLTKFEGYNGSAWGSIGDPAGSNTQLQYNNSGVFGASSALTFDGTTLTVPKIAFASSNTPSLTNYQGGAITSGTAVASTSGTSIDFTSIPSWVKRVTIMLNAVSTNGTSNLRFQVGSGSVTTSGYSGSILGITAGQGTSGSNGNNSLSGLDTYVFNQTSSYVFYGKVVWTLVASNTWCCTGSVATAQASSIGFCTGASPALSGALDRVRLTTENGTDTFDAGTVNILYE